MKKDLACPCCHECQHEHLCCRLRLCGKSSGKGELDVQARCHARTENAGSRKEYELGAQYADCEGRQEGWSYGCWNHKQGLVRDYFNRTQLVEKGVGSGVIYSKDGLIATNNHVVEGAKELVVSLPDGRTYPGRVLGTDPTTDLAVVKIDAKEDLPVAEFGDSDSLMVGELPLPLAIPWVLNSAVRLQRASSVLSTVLSMWGNEILN